MKTANSETVAHISFYENGDWCIGAPENTDNKRLVKLLRISEDTNEIALVYDNGHVNVVPQWLYLDIKDELRGKVLRNGYSTNAGLKHAVEVRNNSIVHIVRERGYLRACAHKLNKIGSTTSKTSNGKKMMPNGSYLIDTIVLDNATMSQLVGNYDAETTKDRGKDIAPADIVLFSSLLGYRLSA